MQAFQGALAEFHLWGPKERPNWVEFGNFE
jgi:hypothetical protein